MKRFTKLMKIIREHKIVSIIIAICLVIFVLFGYTFARYLYNVIDNYILETKGFYFNSDILSMNNKQYKINNWDGVNTYSLSISVNNKKDYLVSTDADISYDIAYTCPSTVTCSLSKTSGVIYKSGTTDSYTLNVTPNSNFAAGDEVVVTTTATSSSPYVKSLSATYTIGVTTAGFSYSIDDSAGSKYLTVNLTNSISFYVVETAFGTYSVGDHISLTTYNTLTTAQKANCYSAKVTLSFSPNNVLLDMTSDAYRNKISGSETTTTLNGYTYVTGFGLKVGADTSEKIIFYKVDPSQNYTYPITNTTEIVQATVVTAS